MQILWLQDQFLLSSKTFLDFGQTFLLPSNYLHDWLCIQANDDDDTDIKSGWKSPHRKKSFSLEKKKLGVSPQGAFLTVFEVLLAFLHTSGSGQWKASSVGIFRSFASPQLIFHVARKRGRRKVPSVNSAKQSCSEKCTIFRDEGLLCLPSPLNFPWLWEIQAAKSKFEP